MRKVEFRKDQAGDDAIEKKIIPFDGRSDRAGDYSAPQLRAVFGIGKSIRDNT